MVIKVKEVESGFVTADFAGQTDQKIWKGAILKVLPRALRKGDKVKTTGGKIGVVTETSGDEITIKSGSTLSVYHRCAICKVIKEAPDPNVTQ